jgi:hypothetical protein
VNILPVFSGVLRLNNIGCVLVAGPLEDEIGVCFNNYERSFFGVRWQTESNVTTFVSIPETFSGGRSGFRNSREASQRLRLLRLLKVG